MKEIVLVKATWSPARRTFSDFKMQVSYVKVVTFLIAIKSMLAN